MRLMLRFVFAIVPGLLAAGDVYQAPSPEPTPAETLMLEYINRCRADPAADAQRIAPPGAEPRLPSSTSIDFAMFRSEMGAIRPAPPLVFDVRLLDAARKHSHYMILNSQGHDEQAGKPGFTGTDPSARVRAAGWNGGAAENCFRDAADPWICHVAFIVDWGPGGPGGMQPGRGHRTNIVNPAYACIGLGAVPHGDRLSVTHNIARDGRRYAGGVVFIDRDRDGWYDLDEGRGAVTVQVGSQRTATWGSGAYTIEIPAGASSLSMRSGGVEMTRPVPAGSDNIKIDWIIPQEQDLAAADKLLAAVDAAKDPASPAARKARIALLIGAEHLALDDGRAARIRSATADLAAALAEDRTAVRTVIDGDAKEARRIIDEKAKTWRGSTAADWFDEAAACLRAAAGAASIPIGSPPTRLRAAAKELRAMLARTAAPEFRTRIEALALNLEGRADAATRGR